MSIGIGLPFWGLWGHRYFRVRRPHRRELQIAGFHIIWTTYVRHDELPKEDARADLRRRLAEANPNPPTDEEIVEIIRESRNPGPGGEPNG